MKKNRKRMVLFICLAANLSILGLLKYLDFIIFNVNRFLSIVNIQEINDSNNIVLPVGVSFYMLQSLGYVMDVYKEKIAPEKNILKYALFVSFFPTILSGPIARADHLLNQIQNGTDFSYDNAKNGLLIMMYGYFEKLLIANRIAAIVDSTYSNYYEKSGGVLLITIFLYGIQIYVDFSGYSHIALGASRILGFHIPDNFRQPYFATGIKDFWKRWHISLSAWLRDYVYVPLGGNRGKKIKLYRNIIITFVISALWHGAGWNYLVWGLLHGIYQMIENMTINFRRCIQQRLRLSNNSLISKIVKATITFILVNFAWLFFRSSSTTMAIEILRRIYMDFKVEDILMNKAYLMGLEETRFFILVIELFAVFFIDVLHERKISIINWLNRQNIVLRWCCYTMIVMILLTGILYDYGIGASSFVYTQF